MNIRCPHCQTLFRVDPARVPPRGIRARCARCGGTFQIAGTSAPGASAGHGGQPSATAPAGAGTPGGSPPRQEHASAERTGAPHGSGAAQGFPGQQGTPAGAGAPAGTAPQRPVFGSRDPNARAQRIARALVSDIVAYHPERREQALAAGTLRSEFRDEIMKSWDEYVAQVGQETAKSTPYFRQALNDILAGGQPVF
ncbi:MAG: hypothetical protein GX539_01075 [Candidatus Cloacimonetes bacterium]|jgi:predicted Zn finger-like uncharacterized protein|nr:hypothetical protein [Candidatus Cloacimonadota bacterium]